MIVTLDKRSDPATDRVPYHKMRSYSGLVPTKPHHPSLQVLVESASHIRCADQLIEIACGDAPDGLVISPQFRTSFLHRATYLYPPMTLAHL